MGQTKPAARPGCGSICGRRRSGNSTAACGQWFLAIPTTANWWLGSKVPLPMSSCRPPPQRWPSPQTKSGFSKSGSPPAPNISRIGPSSPPSRRRCRLWPGPTGPATRSIDLCWPGWNRRASSPPRKPIGPRSAAAFGSIWSASPHLPKNSTPFWPTPLPMPTRSSSSGSWRARSMANAGPGAGSIWPAMPTPTAMRKTGRGRSGPTATG